MRFDKYDRSMPRHEIKRESFVEHITRLYRQILPLRLHWRDRNKNTLLSQAGSSSASKYQLRSIIWKGRKVLEQTFNAITRSSAILPPQHFSSLRSSPSSPPIAPPSSSPSQPSSPSQAQSHSSSLTGTNGIQSLPVVF
ncbi:uncharacterized protein BDR25DRAFT_349175 [Lindgomyces ingoldianus]|uniref:Uncharacterized protein n=1 Tax=Lindgomyces ingoldianus TaxID=673940 RepID=A0ACB6RFY9_9PLEO|nr:uncharacterized protein BDR25DRAFT_349175 [Lindgomyces ingoldianus]KAF2477232.1 hypothetical protein BDR25DRAFT_349175 [Lindgomyces ingoldianus]